jgi:hypothetical protein
VLDRTIREEGDMASDDGRPADEKPPLATYVEADHEGQYVDAPPEALAVYGVTLEELRRHRIGDFAPDGLGPIHRALYRWVTTRGRDFGGGASSVVAPDGRTTPVDCTSITKVGDRDRYRIAFTVGDPDAPPPHRSAVASILDAWREAERDLDQGPAHADFDLARTVAASLRDMYQTVVAERIERDEASG